MKKIYLISITFITLLLSLFIWSCNKHEEVVEPYSEYEFVDITIPKIYKPDLKLNYEEEVLEDYISTFDKTGKEVTGKLRITLPVINGCKISKLEITKNILQATGKEKDFFVKYIKTQHLKSTHDVADCFETCDNGKHKHPGWCKFWCVVEILPL